MSMDPERRRIDDEMAHHLAELQAQLEARGWDPEAARAEARRRFGDPERVARDTRRAGGVSRPGGGPRLEFLSDLRHTFRRLLRAPAFSGSVVLTLALTLGATLAVFSVVWAVLLRPLDLRDPGSLVMLAERMPEGGIERAPVSAGTYQDWRAELTTVSEMGAWEWVSRTLEEPGRPEELLTVQVSGNLLGLLGIQPVLGRALTPADQVEGGTPTTVMISHGFWQRRFGGDPDILGSLLPVDGVNREVVGVLPPHLEVIGVQAELFEPDPLIPDNPTNRGVRTLQVVARLPEGGTLAAVQGEVAAVTEQIALDYPTSARGWSATAIPVTEYMVGQIRPRVMAAGAAVLLLLLAAAVNVANLLLVRAADGERELAVRAALGAGRGRLVRIGLGESLVLGAVGGGLGLGVAALLRGWLTAGYAEILPRSLEAGGMVPTVLAALLLVGLVGIGVGLVPALRGAEGALASLGRGTAGAGRGPGVRYRNALMVAQLGLTTVILVGAGLLVRTALAIGDVELGFQTDGVVAARISLDDERYPSNGEARAYYDALLEEVRSLPGVQAAGLTSALPMDPIAANFDLPTRKDPGTPWGEAAQVDFRIIGEGYMEAAGFRLLEGRFLEDADRGGPLVAVVNRSLAESFWPGESAVGKEIQNVWRQDGFARVVGVVDDTRFYGPMEGSRPELFVPLHQAGWGFMTVVARTAGDPATLVGALERAVTATDPLLPPQAVFPVEMLVRNATQRERFFTLLLSGFAVLALVLAAGGVYGVVAYTVRLRTREMGVRMALGATRSQVSLKVLRNGLLLGLAGVTLGIAAAIPATRVVAGMLFGVRPLDPVTLSAVPALLLAVAGLACLAPALRASRMDPATILREE